MLAHVNVINTTVTFIMLDHKPVALTAKTNKKQVYSDPV